MTRALVVNVSAPYYNLGAAKLAQYLRAQGHEAHEAGFYSPLLDRHYDLVCLSVIFSWDAPRAASMARAAQQHAEVWAGGPGLFSLAAWWTEQTGFEAQIGLDQRFERQPGEYKATFASRGCPVNCSFCIVPQLEGRRFTLYEDFTPAPILYDNNLSALPRHFQQHIVRRYQAAGMPIRDANSGFEPRFFRSETRILWEQVLRGPWRMGFDETREAGAVQRALEILNDVPAYRKQVYCLIGNEPVEECYRRAEAIRAWGGEPFVQAEIPLGALEKEPVIRHDWDRRQLTAFARYYNRHLYRSIKLWEYSDSVTGSRPFAHMAPPTTFILRPQEA